MKITIDISSKQDLILIKKLIDSLDLSEESIMSEKDWSLSKSIEDLELTLWTQNRLLESNIKTVGDLVSYSPVDLLKIDRFGRKSLVEVQDVLWLQFGLKLRDV